jgi:hypothetical protein
MRLKNWHEGEVPQQQLHCIVYPAEKITLIH